MTYKGKIFTNDEIIDGYLSVQDGVITYVGETCPGGDVTETEGIIAPGFIDIHCHSSLRSCAFEDPREVAAFHKSHGTTTMLLTYYRDIPHEELLRCLDRTKEAMADCSNLYGAHLEGPWLNANLGAGVGKNEVPDPERYEAYIATGVVKQWTAAPEIPGVIPMIRWIAEAGIVPSIGHSAATCEEVKAAYEAGARIATHIFDATRAPEPTYEGTLEVDFNEACMLTDGMFCEVIIDREGKHVRPGKFRILKKLAGVDRIVAITDMFASADPVDNGADVAMVNGQLSGTKLTMDRVAENLFNLGCTLPEIFKMTSKNAAAALGLSDRGEIAVGKRADLITVDEHAKLIKLL